MKTIVLGVTSSIACYKVLSLISRLKKDFNIEVIMTSNACKLISRKEFEKKLGKKVHKKMFVKDFTYKDYLKREEMEHISLADKADLFLVCPATANTIGKIANGIGDDLLSTSIMATNAPVLICPAMNCKMWENRIVQGNVDGLRKQGYYFVEPGKGKLACGYSGFGRLAAVDNIEKAVRDIAGKRDRLKGKKIIVTAGGTSEEIDPVRAITNRSSGKMGIYLAEEAAKMGASVTLIRGNTDIEPFGKINDVKVSSVKDMFDAIKKELKGCDIMVHAAAVSDFTVSKKTNKKIKSSKKVSLELSPTIKIINEIKKRNKNVKLVGFKAECNVSKKEILISARALMKKSKANLIVANDVGKDVFGSEDNDVYFVGKKVEHVKDSKREIAGRILEMVR